MKARPCRAFTTFGGLGLLVLASGCAPSSTVISSEDGRLTLTHWDGSVETLTVDPEADITLDGEPAELEALDHGDVVNITTKDRDGVQVVTSIVARSGEPRVREDPMDPHEPTPRMPGRLGDPDPARGWEEPAPRPLEVPVEPDPFREVEDEPVHPPPSEPVPPVDIDDEVDRDLR